MAAFGLSLVLAPAAALAFDPGFTVGGRLEPQLTDQCVARTAGCRSDGYPDARYYRPLAEGQGPQVYSYNDPRYLAPSLPLTRGGYIPTY
jgi:hypothetical protein